MRRFHSLALRVLLLSTGTATAEIHVLGEAVDLADAVNPSSVVSWDADGDGTEELVAFDPMKQRITSSSLGVIDPPHLLFRIERTETFAWADAPGGRIYATDTNGDGIADLVLARGQHIAIWHGKLRNTPAPHGPDWSRSYPLPDFGNRSFLRPADLDGDGRPDLVSDTGNFIVFGIGSDNPATSEGVGHSGSGFQVIGNWDGSGKAVLAARDFRLPLTLVYEIRPDRSLVEIDRVETGGTFVNLAGTFPPQLINVVEPGAPGSPLATIHTRNNGIWTTETVPSPPGSREVLFPSPIHLEVLKSPAGANREILAIAGGGAADLLLIEQGPSSPVLRRKPLGRRFPTGATEPPVIALRALSLQDTPGDALAVFSARNPIPNVFGSYSLPGQIQGTALTLILPDEPLPADDVFQRAGPVGTTIPIDVDGDGRMDLISLRTGTGRLATYFQAGHADFEPAYLILPGTTNAQQMVKGNFTDGTSREIAVSSDGTTRFYSLDGGASVKTGEAFSGDFLLAAGNISGSGADEVLHIDARLETLNHSGSIHPIALAGRTPSQFGGGLGGPPQSPTPNFITRDQLLVTDADDDGDNDIITFPSALGQAFGFHRNDSGRFSIQHMTSDPVPDAFGFFGATIDGFRIGNPTQVFLGKFLTDSSRETLGCYSAGTDSLGNPVNAFVVFSGRPDRSVAVASSFLSVSGKSVITDFDGDGLDDVISTGKRSTDLFGNPVFNTSILFHRSVGDGTFETETLLGNTLGGEVSDFLAEDMNGDGLPDIIAVSAEAGTVEVFLSGSVPSYPSFGTWAGAHSPSAPGQLEDPDGSGVPNLIRFATGRIPASSTDPPPPSPPVQPAIEFNGTFLTATHPVPRLPGGDMLDVKLEYSLDMATWFRAKDPYGLVDDLDHPQWKYKNWGNTYLKDADGNNIASPERIFFRFAITYVPGL